MSKSKNITSIIVGIIILVQLCRNIPMMTSGVRQLDFNFMSAMMTGFWLVMVLIIVVISVFILRNVAELVIAFVYGEECTEDNKVLKIFNKVSSILGVLPQIVGGAMFGGMGIFCLVHPQLRGADIFVKVMAAVFVGFALFIVIRSIRWIVSIIRE